MKCTRLLSDVRLMGGEMSYQVGDKLWFAEEKRPYTVQAMNERYLVCTKPFRARNTVMYTIVDLSLGIRGTENLIFCSGFESGEECREAIQRLSNKDIDMVTEVSHRNRVSLNIVKHRQAA